MASETLSASAISLVVVPPNPRCEKRVTATCRICSFRSSALIRAAPVPWTGGVGGGWMAVSLRKLGLSSGQGYQSKYLLTTEKKGSSKKLVTGTRQMIFLDPRR